MGIIHHPEKRTGSDAADALPSCERYEVSIRLSVRDAGLLWRMAVAKALCYPGYTEEDATEMLGPMEDPSLADCIAMLVGPGDLMGCSYEQFSVVPAGVAVGHAGKARPMPPAPGGRTLF